MARRQLQTIGITALLLHSALSAQQSNPGPQNVSDFFRSFTAEWVRGDPQLATSTRYFKGEEQDQLERQ